jgi:pimeloyl-ACP methyl ester carboxylesterase
MRIARPLRLIALAYVALGLVAVVLYRSALAAQADAVVVLSTVLETPVLTWTVERLTDEPHLEETVVAGAPTTVVRPGGSGPWPALVFVNGATPRGRHHPDVEDLARGLARAGYLVLVPDLPGLADGEITLRTLSVTVAVADHAAELPDARDGGVGLVGVSVGGSLALLAAADPVLSERVTVVAGIAPYTDLANVFRLATIGLYEDDGEAVRYDSANYLALVAARSLVASLANARERRSLLADLPETDEVGENPADPLAHLRARPLEGLTDEARAAVALLVNREPARFDALYATLPSRLRTGHARLSPIAAAGGLRAPIELASAPRDKYFPVAESRALAAAVPEVRLTLTSTLAHAVPEPSPGAIADFFRFDAFVVRVLQRAR